MTTSPSGGGFPPPRATDGAPHRVPRPQQAGVDANTQPPRPPAQAGQRQQSPPAQPRQTPISNEGQPVPRREPQPPPQQQSSGLPRPKPPTAPRSENRVQSTDDLLRSIQSAHQRKARPEGGWRRLIYDLTSGRYNPGPSEEELYEAQLIRDVQTPIDNVKHVVVWAQKGGVGKTTTTTALGVTTASHRTDKVLALDVNPDGGSLAIRVPSTTRYNILDLRDALRSGYVAPNDFDRYVNHAAHRLDSIVMPPGEKVQKDEILTDDDYRLIADALEKRYPYKIIFTDCGTNLTDSVMEGVIPRADQLVVVTTTVMDEATVTAGGLEALAAAGHADLVANAITVVVDKAPRDPNAEVQREIETTASTIREHFAKITSELISVPYDPRVRIGGIFDPSLVSPASHKAHLELARAVILRLAAQDGRI